MTTQPSEVLYVVERLNWRKARHYAEHSRPEWDGYVQLPGGTRLRSFPDVESARRFCAEREQEVRARANPFACGGPALHYQTCFDAARLHDWLLDAGIEPPAAGPDDSRDWRHWWERVAASLSPEQRAHCWAALDKVRFHRVLEQPSRPTVFVVVRRDWEYNDEWNYTPSDGTSPIEAYSTWEKAQKARARRERAVRGGHGEGFSGVYETTDLLWEWAEPFTPVPEGNTFARPGEDLFFEVVEVELEG
jgi:hypothetical protein